MSPVAIYEDRDTFYVPHFEVKIAGHNLEDDILHDVSQVTYRDNINELDTFELTVNNWDAGARKFKYEPPVSGSFKGIFDPGKELELYLGYFNDAPRMLRGQIRTVEPNYPEAGVPTITVRGTNVLDRFRDKQHTWSWPDAKDSDVAEEIGRNAKSDDRPGLAFRVKVSGAARENEQPATLFMNNQFDILFLIERARQRGYAVFVGTDEEGDFINFRPSDEFRRVEYELKWGESLTSFRPTLTNANQVKKVTVKGWDRRTREPISVTAEFPRDCDLNGDLPDIARAADAEEVITNPPAQTEGEARQRATDALCKFRRDLVKANGSTIGLPYLRAGNTVHIKLDGSRFDGPYFVTSTTHTIGAGGYRTTFEARRERM